MRKIITFLGKYPRETRYQYQGNVYSGQVFAEALMQFVEFDELLVFVTEEARQLSLPVLEEKGDPRIKAIDIPIGRNEDEIWQIFSKVVDSVHKNDVVIFDITHGLRSMPFLVFLFAAYLKSVRNAEIEGVYYGAFELARQDEDIPAPIFDLSDFVKMLDWITAGDQFIRTGDAHWLAELMKTENGKLGQLPVVLEKISRANAFCDPFQLMDNAYLFNQMVHKMGDREGSGLQPFWAVQPIISDEIAPFSLSNRQRHGEDKKVAGEMKIIQWHIEHHQLIQATLMLREVLLDLISLKLEEPLDFRRKHRSTIERAVSGLNQIGRRNSDSNGEEDDEFTPADLNQFGREIYDWDDADEIKLIWSSLQNLRNTFAHAAHQAQPMRLDSVERTIHDIYQKVKLLGEKWQLLESETE